MPNQPTPLTSQPPPELPHLTGAGFQPLVDYLRRLALWCRDSLSRKIDAGTALPGLMLQAYDAPAATPAVYDFRVDSAGVASLSPVPIGSGPIGAAVPIVFGYETVAHASATYETITHASSTYETATHASSTYETATHASSTYETSAHASSTYETTAHASSTYLPLAGGTISSTLIVTGLLTGNGGAVINADPEPQLTLGSVSHSCQLKINKPTSGLANNILGYTAGALRWNIALGNTVAEGGSNAGSDFSISRYNDAGTVIDIPFGIDRSSGELTTTKRIVSGTGFGCRAGSAGTLRVDQFNVDWPSANPQMWVNTTNFGTIAYVSDYRVKTDIGPLPSMWNKNKTLNPISYRFKAYNPAWIAPNAINPMFKGDSAEQWGFTAHELQDALIPSAASGVKDQTNVIQSPNPWTLLAVVTKTLQEAQVRIEALEAAAGFPAANLIEVNDMLSGAGTVT